MSDYNWSEVPADVDYMIGILSDVYKEAHGVRPRWLYAVWANWPMEKLEAELEILCREAQDMAEYWDEMEKQWEAELAAQVAEAEEQKHSDTAYGLAELVGGRDSNFAPFWR
jgi:hypothetical protein